MFEWLKKLFGKSDKQKKTDEAIAGLYTNATNKNRTPLDPDGNPWST